MDGDDSLDRGVPMLPHDSGIIPMERTDYLLVSVLILLVCNIAFERITNTILFVLYAGMLIGLPWLVAQQDRLPRWLGLFFERLSERIQAYPQEIVLVVGLGALTVSKWLPLDPRWRELGLIVVVVAGYRLSRRGSLLQSGYLSGTSWFMRRIKRKRKASSPATAEDKPATAPEPIVGREDEPLRKPSSSLTESHSATREVWERKQRQRWEDWMREELDRLDGDYDRSNH